MKIRRYWGLVFFGVLLSIAGILWIRHNLAEVAFNEREATVFEQQLHTQQLHTRDRVVSEDSRLPPLGETDDTGYWEGNTWHERPDPAPKVKWWQRADMRKYYDMVTIGPVPDEFLDPEFLGLGEITGDTSSGRENRFHEWILMEYPYSQAALEIRIYRNSIRDNGSLNALKEALRYHPTSPKLHAHLADCWGYDPEESVAYAKKALRLLTTTSEYDPLDTEARSHDALGFAYQRLADYKSALVHLKKARDFYKSRLHDEGYQSSYDLMVQQIKAIEAGKPRWGPDPQPVSDGSAGAAPVASSVSSSEGPTVSSVVESDVFDGSRGSASKAGEAGSRFPFASPEAAEQARVAFERQREQDIVAYDKFMREMLELDAMRSPEHLEKLVIRELAQQWRGGQTEFRSEDFLRVFSTVRQQYTEQVRQSEERAAALEREMARRQRPPVPGSPKNPPGEEGGR